MDIIFDTTKSFKNYILLFTFLVAISSILGCHKFLDQKPNISDIVPTSLDDLQRLLDNERGVVNSRGTGAYDELISDNYYVSANTWQAAASSSSTINQSEAQNYIWGSLSHDNYWTLPYGGPIYYSNIVLDELPLVKVMAGEESKFNTIKGSALFYRSFSFLGLAQLYCNPYSQANANELGIVLRLTSNLNNKSNRATIQQTYDQIISDLKEAANLLPNNASVATRPSKIAAYAALARAYLTMRDYVNAGHYADLALQQYSTLINYNSLIPIGNPPITPLNAEIVFYDYSPTYVFLTAASGKIDSSLYLSYDVNDLRKSLFFKANTGVNANTFSFRGSYNGNFNVASVFDGLATDELILIRAECSARQGNKDAALADLNTLMINRWKNNGSWIPFTANNATDALNIILIERRKELVYRGLRWPDIRRLSLEGVNINLTRKIGTTNYNLTMNDPRSVMLLPLTEINNNPQVKQNPR